jgi:hypothetical protein
MRKMIFKQGPFNMDVEIIAPGISEDKPLPPGEYIVHLRQIEPTLKRVHTFLEDIEALSDAVEALWNQQGADLAKRKQENWRLLSQILDIAEKLILELQPTDDDGNPKPME